VNKLVEVLKKKNLFVRTLCVRTLPWCTLPSIAFLFELVYNVQKYVWIVQYKMLRVTTIAIVAIVAIVTIRFFFRGHFCVLQG
jgi:hypothetical protein